MSNPPAPTHLRQNDIDKVFSGGGEVAAEMRALDWSQNPLGPVSGWPQSLCTSVGVMLASPQPTFIFWGPEYAMLYNDSGLPILGAKHPESIGQSIKVELKEAWSVLGPLVQSVVDTGTAVYRENLLIPLNRFGFVQDGYYTFSYVPIRNEAAEIGGIFVFVIETTAYVVGARRLALIRELSLRSALCQTVASALLAAEEVLSQAPADVPFALLYELRGEQARLMISAGIERGLAVSPTDLPAKRSLWPLADVAYSGRGMLVEDLPACVGKLPGGPSGELTSRALVLPLAGEGQQAAHQVLIVGLNPRIPLDNEARSFLDLLARQLATSISSIRALEEKTQLAVQLAELDRQKTQFFSNVSHEFRTPLTLILGPTEDALSLPSRALVGADLDRVHSNAQRLLKLVNTLLEFSRIEAGKAHATFQPTDLAKLTTGLANAFASVVVAAGVRFVVDCPPLPEPVWVDRNLWERVVLNLVSNAFKFTLSGQIATRLRWKGQCVELSVEDTGIGIAAEDLPQLFQRFHRVEGAQGRSHEGSGIGLSLVKELVTLQGGEVSVTSKPGAGTTFTVSLPTGFAHLPAQSLQPAEQAVAPGSGTSAFVHEAAKWLPTFNGDGPAQDTASGPHPVPALPAASLRAVRVLLADDNADMRGYIQRVLADHFTVETVANGQLALAAARARLPDVVLSDVMMPVMDGLALTRALREDPRTREVPIILLSARAGENATVEGLQAGADDYIVKPFGARELVARVEGAVKIARAEFARRRALERVSEILESTSDAFFSLDRDWRFVVVNASYQRMSRTRREDVIGLSFWDVFPATREPSSNYWQEYNRCMNERVAVQFLEYYAPLDLWTDVRADPTPEGGIAVSFRDVSLEVQAKANLARQAEFEKQLIGIVSHDLRNPLNAIMMGATILQEYEGLQDRSLKIVKRIQSSADRANRLVRDLLDFTQARLGGGIPIERQPIDLHEVLRSVLDELRAAHPERSVALHSAGTGLGEWDADRLAQLVQNLVTNAVKYSPTDTAVQLLTTGTEHAVAIAVHNFGVPISADQIERLFQPMQRGTDELTSASRSVGLGLYIVKQIVDAHGGTVTVQSNADMGTTFTVSLPRRAPVT